MQLTRYEDVKDISTEEYFEGNVFSIDAFNRKYRLYEDETYVQAIKRVCDAIASVEDTEEARAYWSERWFDEIYHDWWHPAGSIMQGAGSGKNISLANCSTTSLGARQELANWDNLESIIRNTAYTVAKSAAFRQGQGIDFSAIRPKGMSVKNSAREGTGAVHWMKYIDSIGYYVGQAGRIPALLISLRVDHPDVIDFIKSKVDFTVIQNANISVQCTDDFYRAAENNEDWTMSYTIPAVKKGDKVYLDVHSALMDAEKDEKGYFVYAKRDREEETYSVTAPANEILELIAKGMCEYAEPGVQNIDIAIRESNSDYVYDPLAEYDSRIISTNAPLSGDTLIPTVNGLIKIKDLFAQQTANIITDTMVLNDLELYSKQHRTPPGSQPVIVESKFKKYNNQQVVKIIFTDGSEIKCNPEHKWLTLNGTMKCAKDLTNSDSILKSNYGIAQATNTYPDICSTNYENGLLIGYLVGDGFIMKASKNHKKAYGILYDNSCLEYRDLFQAKYAECNEDKKQLEYERDRGKIKEMRSENQKFITWLDGFGFEDHKYVVPELCYSNMDFCSGYLRGLFASDGCVKKGGTQVVLTSVSKELIYKVQELLAGWFGINTRIKISKSKGVHYGDNKVSQAKDRYDLVINNFDSINQFVKYIGLGGYKGERLMSRPDTVSRNVRNSLPIKEIVITDEYEDMYCAYVPDYHAFVATNGLISSNCSEQYLSRDSLCILSSINVGKFSVIPAEYKEQLRKIGHSINRFLDNVNEYELRNHTYATPHQKLAIESLRRTGAGFTNLEAWLFKQSLVYGSEEGNNVSQEFQKWYNYYCYESSIKLGAEKGNFGLFNKEKLIRSPFIQRMMSLGLEFDTLRNITCTSIAPTGSLSLMFRGLILSYGIEKGFGAYFWKRTRISGKYEYYFNVPRVVREVFEQHGLTIPMESDTIKDTWDGKCGIPIAKFIDENMSKLGVPFEPSTQLNVLDKLDLMCKIQQWVDSSLSTTYMLPEDTDWKGVADFILEGWRRGLKSIAAFPDRKMYGIVSYIPFKELAQKLISDGKEIHAQNFTPEELKQLSLIPPVEMPKRRPKEVEGEICTATAKGKKFLFFVGLVGGKPFEMFGGELPEKMHIKDGKATMIKVINDDDSRFYSLKIGDVVFENFGSYFTPHEEAMFRAVSYMLQNGDSIDRIAKYLKGCSHREGIASLYSATRRVLLKYSTEDKEATTKVSGRTCPLCTSNNVIYEAGCIKCGDCGWSKCE